ncbi:MAG: hypothetical protein PQJ46_14005 [Spirochaetales bacterium]|nr:hypothetical protein [Spirochaetales bacterium]
MVLNIIFFLVSIAILAVIYILLRKRIDKLTDTKKMSSEMSGELDIILSEINQATDRNIQIIEDRIKQLEELVEKADSRITLLDKKTTTKEVISPKRHTPSPEKKSEKQIQLEIPEKEDDKNELTYSHLNRMSVMSDMITPMAVTEKKTNGTIDIKQKIIALYKNGIDSSIIASNVGINLGEVELIISLYKQANGL